MLRVRRDSYRYSFRDSSFEDVFKQKDHRLVGTFQTWTLHLVSFPVVSRRSPAEAIATAFPYRY